jgi:hypothetical protein
VGLGIAAILMIEFALEGIGYQYYLLGSKKKRSVVKK